MTLNAMETWESIWGQWPVQGICVCVLVTVFMRVFMYGCVCLDECVYMWWCTTYSYVCVCVWERVRESMYGLAWVYTCVCRSGCLCVCVCVWATFDSSILIWKVGGLSKSILVQRCRHIKTGIKCRVGEALHSSAMFPASQLEREL